jgi:hypothetical protein
MAGNILIDITGNRYGMLTVIGKEETLKNGMTRWKCLCDCGKTTVSYGVNLKRGLTKSCGCNTYKNRETTNRKKNLRLYAIWKAIKWRCYREKSNSYQLYGGRGIKMCDEWKDSYEAFYQWSMSHGYADDLTIDRINTNGNYEPDNCRWITKKEQSRNTRRNIVIKYHGEEKTLPEWCDVLGLPYARVCGRYKRMRSRGREIDVNELFYDGRLPNYRKKDS